MSVNYEVRLYTPRGEFLTAITNIVDAGGHGLEYVLRSDGQIGALSLTVPRGELDNYFHWANVDYKIGVWRSINGAPFYLDNDAYFFVRTFEYTDSYTKITAYHALELLTRRLNAYRKNTHNNWGPDQPNISEAAMKNEASVYKRNCGDIMKGIVRQNYSYEYFDKGIPGRGNAGQFGLFNKISRWNQKLTDKNNAGVGSWTANVYLPNLDLSQFLKIEPEKSDGLSGVSIDLNGDVVYDLLKKLMDQSKGGSEEYGLLPIWMSFDIKAINERQFIFRTYANCYGTDRSNGRFIFASYRGNLADAKMTLDRSEEATIIYSIDKDENIRAAINRRRMGDSPFNLREGLSNPQIKEKTYKNQKKGVKITNPSTFTVPMILQTDASHELLKRVPRVKIEGKAVLTPSSIRGLHWDVGDLVTLDYRGYRDNYRINAVSVSISNGTINEDVQWEAVDVAGYGEDTTNDGIVDPIPE